MKNLLLGLLILGNISTVLASTVEYPAVLGRPILGNRGIKSDYYEIEKANQFCEKFTDYEPGYKSFATSHSIVKMTQEDAAKMFKNAIDCEVTFGGECGFSSIIIPNRNVLIEYRPLKKTRWVKVFSSITCNKSIWNPAYYQADQE